MAEGGGERRLKTRLSREYASEKAMAASSLGYTWENFSHWVSCMCVVTFDLELGQALEVRERALEDQQLRVIRLYADPFI